MSGLCYIAGPMRGHPQFNFPAFDSCAGYMRKHGWGVYNPAQHDREVYGAEMANWPGFNSGRVEDCPEFSIERAMRWDLGRITECDAIVLLPEWEKSTGVANEIHVANACGLEVLYAYPCHSGNLFKWTDENSHHVGWADEDNWFVSEVNLDAAVSA